MFINDKLSNKIRWLNDNKRDVDLPIYNEKLADIYDKNLAQAHFAAAEEIKKYVHWYNNERIQKKLGYLSPVQYRLKYLNQ